MLLRASHARPVRRLAHVAVACAKIAVRGHSVVLDVTRNVSVDVYNPPQIGLDHPDALVSQVACSAAFCLFLLRTYAPREQLSAN